MPELEVLELVCLKTFTQGWPNAARAPKERQGFCRYTINVPFLMPFAAVLTLLFFSGSVRPESRNNVNILLPLLLGLQPVAV